MTENIEKFFDNEDLEDQELFAEEIPENPIMETEQVEFPLEDSGQNGTIARCFGTIRIIAR